MNAITTAAHEIAVEAIDQLAAAAQTIAQLETLFRSIRTNLGENSDAARLVALGEYAAMDQSSCFDRESDKLSERLEKLAPQNAQSENVARNYEGRPTFAERIKLVREEAGLTQADLAKACGVSQANISELERGEVGRTSYLPEIARACGASTDWLAFGNVARESEVQP